VKNYLDYYKHLKIKNESKRSIHFQVSITNEHLLFIYYIKYNDIMNNLDTKQFHFELN